MFIQGSADLAGATGFSVVDGATSTPTNTAATHVATLADKVVQFELPSNVQRYIKVVLTGTPTAGTWTCGVVLPGLRTAFK